MTVPYTDKINQRIIGFEQQIFAESHFVGITSLNTVSPDTIRLIEIPLLETPSSVVIVGFSEVTTLPGLAEYKVDYTNGRILFNPALIPQFVTVDYKGRGSIIDSEDINEIQQVFVGAVTPGSPTIGIASLDGTLSAGIVRPGNISTVLTDDFNFLRDVQVGRDLTVLGNLDVRGTLTTIQTEIVEIDDNILELNSNVTGAPTEDSGIEIERGSSNNVQLIWEETIDGWQMKDSSGSSILTALDTGLVGLGTDDPKAKFHNTGSTILGIDSATDPGSITVSQVNNFTGVVVDTTGAVVLTVPSPTNTVEGRFFTVVHEDGSTGTLTVDGKIVNVGQGITLMWSGTIWSIISNSGRLALIAGDPGTPSQGDTWLDTSTKQVKAYNGTDIVLLG